MDSKPGAIDSLELVGDYCAHFEGQPIGNTAALAADVSVLVRERFRD
jgi:hypothetical protein